MAAQPADKASSPTHLMELFAKEPPPATSTS